MSTTPVTSTITNRDGHEHAYDLATTSRLLLARGSDQRLGATTVNLSSGDVPPNNYQPLTGAELDVMSSLADVELELEI